MNRRSFFKNTTLATVGTGLLFPEQIFANEILSNKNKKAKNIIFMVSDGMSSGTLNMADIYMQRKYGKGSNWLNLYRENKVRRGLMDMASASSIVTDSAAASSSWGSGFRVKNGSLNVSVDGEALLPIWQKFKKVGKKAGCVTTVPITHATPAGFLVNSKSRNSQEDIAETYLSQGFDVLLGGGDQYFNAEKRKDKKDLYTAYAQKGYQVVKNKTSLKNTNASKPVLGVFYQDALPYRVDWNHQTDLQEKVPTLAEMTTKAIDLMKDHSKGFVLQVEAGRVDWAAHANDIGGLLYDQVAFDEALQVAIDFTEKNPDTLLIICTDHGNANPGLLYGKNANEHFDSLQSYQQSNDFLLNQITPQNSVQQIQEMIQSVHGIVLEKEEAQTLHKYYQGLEPNEEGIYNYKNLPFATYAQMQKKRNSVGWIGTDHSADFVEICMMGAGSHLMPGFLKNTDLHYLMLQAAEVENKF